MGKLTAKSVQSIIKSKKSGKYSDGGGLYIVMPKSGSPYWMARYTIHRKRKEMKLAKVEHLSLANARVEVVAVTRIVNEGRDPLMERQKEQSQHIKLVDDLFNDWFLDLQKRLKHPRIPKRIYMKEIAPSIGQALVRDVTPMDVRSIIQAIKLSNRPSISNDALMYLKQMFNHGIKLGVILSNPAVAFTVNDAGGVEKSRARALTMNEVKHVFEVFSNNSSRFTRENYLAVCLLLVLGVRKGELIESRWVEFDLNKNAWELPESRSKSGVGLRIPLPYQAVSWLRELKVRSFDSEYVFPNRRSSKSPCMGKDTLNKAIACLFGQDSSHKTKPENLMGDMEYFTVHDLRRTCRSLLSSLGVSGHVAERCLNHKLKGVEGIYDKYDYFEERKDAHQKLADSLDVILN